MSDRPEQPRAPIGAAPDAERPEALIRYGDAADRASPHPLYCVWEITLACDLGCKHCGSRAGNARDVELTTAQCLDVVAQMADMGLREVTLIGGEAYLREDWDQIAAEITRRGMTCGVTTGGRGFNAERVQRAVDAGVHSVSVSIDGLKRTHDAQRGAPGSWQAAVDSARRVAASPMRLATNTQVNRLSLPELPALTHLLADLGTEAWQVQITVPMGRGADRPGLPLQPDQLLELFPLLVWLKEQRLVPHGVRLFAGNNVGYYGPYEEALRFGGHRGAHWAGCSAGKWCMAVEADGKIKACPSLPSQEWTGGYAQRDAMAEVVTTAPEMTHLMNRTVDDLWGFCRTCYYAETCKAGCTWTSQCILGKPGNNPYCIHRAMEHEKQGQRERLVHVEAAPGLPFDHGRFELVVEDAAAPPAAPQVGSFPLAEVMALDWQSGGIWTDAELRDALARVGRRLVQVGG
jgi:radical SAM protein with 4Fe4S-binding SPASM domain